MSRTFSSALHLSNHRKPVNTLTHVMVPLQVAADDAETRVLAPTVHMLLIPAMVPCSQPSMAQHLLSPPNGAGGCR